jgi:hypothetical protein
MRASREEKQGDSCDVSGCSETAERSMSRKKVKEAMDWNLKGDDKRVGLCKTHYREFKKATKEDRKLESLRR